MFAFALVAAGRVPALAVWSAGRLCARRAFVDILTGELRVARIVWRTLAEVAARRVDTLGAGTAHGSRSAAAATRCRALVYIETGLEARVAAGCRANGRHQGGHFYLLARLDDLAEHAGRKQGVALEAGRTRALVAAWNVRALSSQAARISPALVHVCASRRSSSQYRAKRRGGEGEHKLISMVALVSVCHSN